MQCRMFEFTVESVNYISCKHAQAKEAAMLLFKIAVDQVMKKLITREEAVMRINVEAIRSLLHKKD